MTPKIPRALTLAVPLSVALSLVTVPLAGASAHGGGRVETRAAAGDLDPAEFADPSTGYRPGVRWWWPGNGASEEDLLDQVDYLADNGFGAVEIVSFSKGFLTGDGTTAGYIYDGQDLGYDVDQILSYDSPEYYDKLDAVVARANERGLTVDLNIGSGYLANDDSIEVGDSQGNMALGRATVAFDEVDGFTLTSGDIAVPGGVGTVQLGVPAAEKSPFYASENFGLDFGVWSEDDVSLASVILAPIEGEGEPLTTNNQVVTSDSDEVKTYAHQTVVDLQDATVVYPDAQTGTFSVDTAGLAEGAYEVIALYSVPAGSYGLNSILENTTTDKRNYVVDHLDPSAITNLVKGWLSEPALTDIVESRDIRAGFNDSYEFYTDNHYNEIVQASAESEELLGYDFTKFLPSFYAFYQESFLIDGAPEVKDEYSEQGLNDLQLSSFGGARPTLLETGLTDDEAARVTYDYGRLLNDAFLAGMQAFSSTLADYGIVYRQQAYNPPVDQLKAASVVDIPETEGLNEYNLKQVSSGAHLYGKNLVTSEVYTLGSTPFTVTPGFIKQGYDLMATSGVNNFFYHGLSATYHGNTDPSFTSDDDLFAEEGWRAWPTIGVEMSATDPTSAYYGSMNDYAARANYVMQSGTTSSDVAVYMPLFGSVATSAGFNEPATPLASITALQTNGYAWDAINDDTIQTGLEWDGSQLVANGGNITFDALVVESSTMPVETAEALQELKSAGAPIYFYGSAPSSQPGYADGDYAQLDARVADIASAMDGVVDEDGFLADLATLDAAPISYAPNADVRFNRRALPSGGELAYIRNTAETPTAIDLTVSPALTACHWLDQETGHIFGADVADGGASITLDGSGAVILLCEPGSGTISAEAVTPGAPAQIDVTPRPVVQELTDFTLSVTADNIGGPRPGESRTASYSGAGVLGDWSAEGFLDGDLAYVASAGTYRTSVDVPDAGDFADGGAVLDLGTVHDAATVRVNPGTADEQVVQLYHAPFRVDIASALVSGTNVIEVDVQPVKNNRRAGLKQLYQSDPVADAQYIAYASVQASDALMPAGLVGPVTLNTAVESAAEPAAPAAALAVDPGTVEQGGSTSVTGSGFGAEETVRLELRSAPVELGSATADADGRFASTVTVPGTTAVGEHQVVAIRDDGSEVAAVLEVVAAAAPGDGAGPDSGTDTETDTETGGGADTETGDGTAAGTDTTTGSERAGGDLATTGAEVGWLAALGGLILAAGVTGLVVSRRRRGPADSS